MKRCFDGWDPRNPGGDDESVKEESSGDGPPRGGEIRRDLRLILLYCDLGIIEGLVHWIGLGSTSVAHRVMLSVRTLLHSLSANPCDSKKRRMRGLSHSSTSSRTGTSTLRASSLSTVRRAICVMY